MASNFRLVSTLLLLLITTAHLLPKVSTSSSLSNDDLPTLYEYFSEGGIQSGLVPEDTREFKLNGKPIRVISGAIHYFRIHPSKWRSSLRKLRATGANTVETYVAWNLHEPRRGEFDFGNGGNDFSKFLNLRAYIEIAQEEDLLVLLRPGPYICTEFEFGGFPSWLLRDSQMRVRGSYQPFLDAVESYFDELLGRQLTNLQFIKGGPIIGIQIENEYANFDKVDKTYLKAIVNFTRAAGYDDNMLLYTSDGAWAGDYATLDELFWTANFNHDPEDNLNMLMEKQPNKPLFVMEFWIGWYTYWFQSTYQTGLSPDELRHNLDVILSPPYNSSVNFYMFQGGTNFGFLAGGREESKVTSYDYYCALSESGDYTEKYNIIVELIDKHAVPKLRKPVQPVQELKEAYDAVVPQLYLNFDDILTQVPITSKFKVEMPTAMETLDMNNGNGQSFGYIVHQFSSNEARNGSLLKAGVVKDFATVVVDGVNQVSSFMGEGNDRYWIRSEREIPLDIQTDAGSHVISILIENMGRVNGGGESEYMDRKGLPEGHVSLDGVEVTGFDVFALEFKSDWVKNLTNFKMVDDVKTLQAPLIVQTTFEVSGEPLDTFVDLISSGFHKGIVMVNGFNIGRYFRVGPQQRLYIPGSILHTGENKITIFEQLEVGTDIKFRATPDLVR